MEKTSIGIWEKDESLRHGGTFNEILEIVSLRFEEVFGHEVMSKIKLHIENDISAEKPRIIPKVQKESIIIRLCLKNFNKRDQIAFQFSHELCHYVFYSLKGLEEYTGLNEKERAREIMCTAMSLIIMKELFPREFDSWKQYVESLPEDYYRDGAEFAENINYDINKLKLRIAECH